MSSAPNSLAEAAKKHFYGTGRRREAVARVYIKPGPAQFTVNDRPVDDYFRNVAWHTAAVEPLKFTQMLDQVQVRAQVGVGPFDEGKGEGFTLRVELDVTIPEVDQATAEELVAAAHRTCPYSNATRGNIEVVVRAKGGR